MKLLDLYERATINFTSGVIDILDKHKRETDKFGGEVRVSIVRDQQLSAAVMNETGFIMHWIKASITSGNKWNIKEVRGDMIKKIVGSKKTISDEQMTQAVEAVFAAAKKYYK
jgi:hypothetical protein